MRCQHLGAIAVVTLLACLAGQAPAQPRPRPGAPRPAAPSGPTLKLGALLPLNGPGSWFGAEIKQGLELARAELDPGPPLSPSTTEGSAQESEKRAGQRGDAEGRPREPAADAGPVERNHAESRAR